MSVNNRIHKPHTPFSFGQQPSGAFPQRQQPVPTTGVQSGSSPFQAAFGSPPQQPDQLGVFKTQMQAGNFDLNKPALPYTASKGWSA